MIPPLLPCADSYIYTRRYRHYLHTLLSVLSVEQHSTISSSEDTNTPPQQNAGENSSRLFFGFSFCLFPLEPPADYSSWGFNEYDNRVHRSHWSSLRCCWPPPQSALSRRARNPGPPSSVKKKKSTLTEPSRTSMNENHCLCNIFVRKNSAKSTRTRFSRPLGPGDRRFSIYSLSSLMYAKTVALLARSCRYRHSSRF